MKAAIKFIMTLTGLLLIAINIGTVLLLTQFEGLLRQGITRQAGQILGSEVHLEGVRIDWSRQAIEFKGISVFNPEGFSDREAFRLESAWVYPQWLAIFSKTPVIDQVRIGEAQLQLQYDEAKGTNLGAMMERARDWADQQTRGGRDPPVTCPGAQRPTGTADLLRGAADRGVVLRDTAAARRCDRRS